MKSNACKISQKLGQHVMTGIIRSKEKYFLNADEASINDMIKNHRKECTKCSKNLQEKLKSIACFSKTLSATQKKYGVPEKQALTVIKSSEHFRHSYI